MAGGGGGGGQGGGSSTPPTETCEVIDLSQPSPQWRRVASMHRPRRHMNATILPDGKVLVTGGSSAPNNDARQAVYAAEMWDPNTEQWTGHGQHAGAAHVPFDGDVLPDGRVLSAGGGRPPARGGQQLQQLRDLFSALSVPRQAPAINSVPTSIGYGQPFTIDCTDANQIWQVTMLRHAAVTHCINMDQRFQRLAFRQDSGSCGPG